MDFKLRHYPQIEVVRFWSGFGLAASSRLSQIECNFLNQLQIDSYLLDSKAKLSETKPIESARRGLCIQRTTADFSYHTAFLALRYGGAAAAGAHQGEHPDRVPGDDGDVLLRKQSLVGRLPEDQLVASSRGRMA